MYILYLSKYPRYPNFQISKFKSMLSPHMVYRNLDTIYIWPVYV